MAKGVHCLLLTFVAILTTGSHAAKYEGSYRPQARQREIGMREVAEDALWEESRRGLDCKALGEGCGGVIRCCGAAVCYWEDGFHLIKGKCVECVKAGRSCFRNSMCCAGLQCEKGNALHVNGACIAKKPTGAACYRNTQCASGSCPWTKWWAFKGNCS